MSEVRESECVDCANVASGGPHGDGRLCRSCGRWRGEEHSDGCPVGRRARASAPELEAQVEAPAEAAPVGVSVDAAVRPRKRRKAERGEG